MTYEQTVKAVAEELGISISAIDIEMARRRGVDDQGVVIEPSLGKGPVDGDHLLRELSVVFTRHSYFQQKGAATILSLYSIFTHGHDCFQHSPNLIIESPTRGSGKTRVVRTLSKLVANPESVSHATSAAIFHLIDQGPCTLLLDEFDSWENVDGEMRGIIDSGHERTAARVLRVKGKFSTWAPKVIAVIGSVPHTIEHRSIKIVMHPKPRELQVRDLPTKLGNMYVVLNGKIQRWIFDNADLLANYEPIRPPGLDDRGFDNWRPLLAIAELCGGRWPARARRACEHASLFMELQDPLVLLLWDLWSLFERTGRSVLSTSEIVKYLKRMDGRPWPDYHGPGKPINGRSIATLLKRLRIEPQQVAVRGNRPNGYRREWFEKWLEIYPRPRENKRTSQLRVRLTTRAVG